MREWAGPSVVRYFAKLFRPAAGPRLSGEPTTLMDAFSRLGLAVMVILLFVLPRSVPR